ncbi:DNA alkylation repair protein [Vibrio sp. WXL103]|uniref:DNA alkylation repair protein n=1 Tax=Vibrio sp. WXL103 TaxID=3450710 RepID=UPI003EC50544
MSNQPLHSWNQAIKSVIEPLADETNALNMQAYMRDQFSFYGIQSSLRRAAVKQLFSKKSLPPVSSVSEIVRELWSLPQREYQLIAVDLLIKYKHQLPVIYADELEFLITTKSWWDSVDMLATHIASALYKNYPQQIAPYIKRWRKSDNIWLRRTALLYQLKFKQQTDIGLLFEMIRENQHDKEFFIQKAIGWALREYSKTDATAVVRFIDDEKIDGLAKREGLKWLRNNSSLV